MPQASPTCYVVALPVLGSLEEVSGVSSVAGQGSHRPCLPCGCTAKRNDEINCTAMQRRGASRRPGTSLHLQFVCWEVTVLPQRRPVEVVDLARLMHCPGACSSRSGWTKDGLHPVVET